jgi:hypothetical protein
MDRNQQAAAYLALLQPAALEQQDIAFKSQLLRIRFDYSLESLARIDEMVRGLRQSLTLGYGDFLDKQPAVNFISALNFYVGTTIARNGNFALKWIDHQQARQFMPGLNASMETDLGCIIGEGIFFPANVIAEMLFDPNPERSCSSFSQKIITTQTAKGMRLPDPVPKPAASPPAANLAPNWKDALEGAGFLGAWGIAEVAAGIQPKPVCLLPGQGDQRNLIDFSSFGHTNAQDAIADGMGRLQGNPERAPWQALYYDGFVNLPVGRRDALVVELRVYEPASPAAKKSLLGGLFKGKPAAAKTSLSLTMALPYRPSSDGLGFANFAPRLVECSHKGADMAALLDAFYRGIYTAKHFQWDQHFADD